MVTGEANHWFLLLEKEPLPAAENMARDEFLFQLCHEKKIGFFRLYTWDKPSFSFGVSQKISRAVDLDFVEKNGCSFVRRITGGKTVLHDDEVTYSVISSEDIFYRDNDLYRSYMLISTILVNAFHSLGLDAYLSKGSPSHLSRSNNPCFSFPTPNELEIDGKKIVGSAQKRDHIALLQHGSIPISMNFDLYAGGANSTPEAIKGSMTTLAQLSSITREDLIRALITAFRDFIRSPLENYRFTPEEIISIAQFKEKYLSHQWNFKF